jgi:hypothetical protein
MTVSTDPTKTGVSNPARVLGQSATANPLTGGTGETTLATVSVPGGAMGASGSIRITALVTCTNNANVKTLTFKYGGQSFGAVSLANQLSGHVQVTIRNRTAATQISWLNGGSAYGVTTAAVTTTRAIDTTVAQDATITGTLANGADTLTLEGFTVELLP